MEDRTILELFDLNSNAFKTTQEEYDDEDSEYYNYYCYGPYPGGFEAEEEERITAIFSSTKDIALSYHEEYLSEIGEEVKGEFLRMIQSIDKQLLKIGLYKKPLTAREIYNLSEGGFDTIEELVFTILEYRHLCGLFSFDNGWYNYRLKEDVFEWMKETFGENIRDFRHYTYTQKIYYDRQDGSDLEEMNNILSYAIVLQFLEGGTDGDYITANLEANSRYYPDDFWGWFMNEGLEFSKYNREKTDTCQFFHHQIEESTQGYILYLYQKDYKRLRALLPVWEKEFKL
ncbi:MAG: hypothetical protein ACRBFS_11970 [Aureispira sp.]